MICEMCGAEVPRLKAVMIEGSSLNVCPNCAKFGEDSQAGRDIPDAVGPDTITQRLERRERRLRAKDVLQGGEEELAMDFPKRIRRARSSMGLSQEELAKKLNEKKSVVAKLETGDMVPDDKLLKKLERTLGISLKEKVSSTAPPKRGGESKGFTLGDFIKTKKK